MDPILNPSPSGALLKRKEREAKERERSSTSGKKFLFIFEYVSQKEGPHF